MAKMRQAEIVKFNHSAPRLAPLRTEEEKINQQVLRAIKETRQRIATEKQEREARRVASGKFNSIRGLDRLVCPRCNTICGNLSH